MSGFVLIFILAIVISSAAPSLVFGHRGGGGPAGGGSAATLLKDYGAAERDENEAGVDEGAPAREADAEERGAEGDEWDRAFRKSRHQSLRKGSLAA
jgi:hypothetical protein